jgi:hypothetical protein
VVTVSYDEKPGIQALAQKKPDRPPMPGPHGSPTRDFEYKRLGTVSLLAGVDLHRGTVTEIVLMPSLKRRKRQSSSESAFL